MIGNQANHCNRIRKLSGFTLVEVLISLVIFSIISTMAYTGLMSVIKTRQASEAQMDRVQKLQRAFLFLSRDFEQTIDRIARDEFGKPITPSFRAQESGDFRVELTRAGWRNPAERPRSTLQRVGYRIDQERLVRIFWSELDLPEQPKVHEMILLEGITDVKFEFYDDKQEKHEIWPPKQTTKPSGAPPANPAGTTPPVTKPKKNVLPKAVEISFELEAVGKINRIFIVPGDA